MTIFAMQELQPFAFGVHFVSHFEIFIICVRLVVLILLRRPSRNKTLIENMIVVKHLCQCAFLLSNVDLVE